MTGDNVTLSFLHLQTESGGTYGIKVSPVTAPASSRLLNFAIDNVTINGIAQRDLTLNGVNGATIDHVNVNNTTNGNGIR